MINLKFDFLLHLINPFKKKDKKFEKKYLKQRFY